ncbi:DUF3592 domain-containing protein [Kitasatospora sp. NPDC004614]|uniref:DUF3592 domain-containing protein n=1 Tax=unclassified Kitasatospora TaxID=2633591 RepID=UPI00369110E4
MNDAVDTFTTVFGLITGLMALVGLLISGLGASGVVFALRRFRRRDRVRTEGLVAEAEVLDAYLTQDRVADSVTIRTSRYVILGFRTADGRDIRLRDTTGIPRIVGDRVTVRYLPAHPQEAIPADAPGSGRHPGHVVVLAIGSFFAVAGLVFAVAAIGMSVFASQMPTDLPTPTPGSNWP